ncbi:MAG: FeoA family protein [Oscillospiraceae bacterium]
MCKNHCLRDVPPGSCAVIARLDTRGAMRRRLLDIGLIEGTRVECLGRAPSGDPAAYLIRGAVIALRREDCRDIIIC